MEYLSLYLVCNSFNGKTREQNYINSINIIYTFYIKYIYEWINAKKKKNNIRVNRYKTKYGFILFFIINMITYIIIYSFIL